MRSSQTSTPQTSTAPHDAAGKPVAKAQAKPSYAVTVSVRDVGLAGSSPVTATYTLTVSDVNEAPTAVALNNPTNSLAENTLVNSRRKVADIAITDDALGTETFEVTGTDAQWFEADATGLRNLDVRSKIVLDLSDAALTAVAGKTLRIVNDGGTFDHDGEPDTPSLGYQSENARNDILIDVSTGATTIRVDGAATTVLPTSMLKSLVSNTSTVTLDAVNRKLVIDLCVDLDLSNSYHIEIDAGAFTNAAGIGNAAITDAAAMAFSTVRPAEDNGANDSANREGSLSQAMTPTGLVASYRWIDLVGRGSVQSDTLVSTHIFDGGAQKYAFAFADIGDIAGIASAEFLTRVFNFGADDLIYIDSQGDGFTVPTATIAETAEQAWTVPVAVDYVTVNASGAGVIGNSALVNRPARTFGKFSLAAGDELGGGGQLRLSLDPALEGLLNPMNSNRDSLDDVAVAPQNIEDFNTKLNGGVAPNLGANGNWLNPENPALYVVLG